MDDPNPNTSESVSVKVSSVAHLKLGLDLRESVDTSWRDPCVWHYLLFADEKI